MKYRSAFVGCLFQVLCGGSAILPFDGDADCAANCAQCDGSLYHEATVDPAARLVISGSFVAPAN